MFSRGALLEDRRAIAVVGTRQASEQGLRIASAVARELALNKVTVVSGLARGIDIAVHRAALEAGGRTVAVIGTGINRFYPSENRALQQRIAQEGAVVSQFWPDAPPSKQSFPMRNAVMSGYAAATVVVEAPWKSGARIQARLASGSRARNDPGGHVRWSGRRSTTAPPQRSIARPAGPVTRWAGRWAGLPPAVRPCPVSRSGVRIR
ncbi:DNA-processing protein DprA [Planomonospora sp. ID82291]|uniref:DNA-processing protein DprA n=1 Tax=Planomonospora sp. ID82291 TaxID=2738136 RepID=UPI0018C36BAF|nr:DNA-processing protein DprA [Planomonospora sp. ID82291]